MLMSTQPHTRSLQRQILSALCLLFLAPLTMLAQSRKNVVDEVAWVVGDEPILLSDIERQRMYYESMGQPFQGDPRCIIPEQMAISKLFLNQAKIDSIEPNQQMINANVNQWLEQVTNQLGSKEKLEEYLGQKYSQIREERRKVVAEQYTVMQMQQKIVGEVMVAPSEVNRFYEQINKDSLPFVPTTVEVQILTLQPKISVKEVDAVKQRLVDFTEQVNSGKSDFETLARLYSKDNETALRGGEIGFVGRAELEPEFANVAFSLNDPKKVSRIVETKRGYHIIQLIEKRGDLINVRHIMLSPEVNQEELLATNSRMDSIAGIITRDSVPFATAALYYSSDEDTRLSNGQMVNANQQSSLFGTSRFQMSDLPQEMSPLVAELSEGEITKPFTMTDKNNHLVVAIARLKNRKPGHRANVVDDYQVIKDMVEGKKREELLDEWIREKQKTTYVSIAPAYRQCTFQYPGWVLREGTEKE